MRSINEAKAFGGIGALLMLIGTFTNGGPILWILGLVFIFIAVKAISKITKDEDVYSNYLMYFIFSILAIIAIVIILGIAFGVAGGFSWVNEVSKLQPNDITDLNMFWDLFGDMIVGAIVALVVGWVLVIISALYLRKCYNSIAEHTKVDLFKTTGKWYFLGAITSIILIGIIILFIAKSMEIVAFFSLPDKLSTPKES